MNPDIELDRRNTIQEKIRTKQQQLSQETTFSNVRSMSRHAMEVEKSLNRGTKKSNAFTHLIQSQNKGVIDVKSILHLFTRYAAKILF